MAFLQNSLVFDQSQARQRHRNASPAWTGVSFCPVETSCQRKQQSAIPRKDPARSC
ncbi:hypothetical protein FZ985_08535 [Synechococcus sp. MU1650]|nr:hypothetical protein [Synechococcus sp. MU1650]